MELFPVIKYNVSTAVKEALTSAHLYAAAGMERMARNIRKNCVVKACEENGIPIIQSGLRVRVSSRNIYRWGGFDWDLKAIESSSLEVPIAILAKMVMVKEQDRLKIAVPRAAQDPVLLYQLPFFDDPAFIELARWE